MGCACGVDVCYGRLRLTSVRGASELTISLITVPQPVRYSICTHILPDSIHDSGMIHFTHKGTRGSVAPVSTDSAHVGGYSRIMAGCGAKILFSHRRTRTTQTIFFDESGINLSTSCSLATNQVYVPIFSPFNLFCDDEF